MGFGHETEKLVLACSARIVGDPALLDAAGVAGVLREDEMTGQDTDRTRTGHGQDTDAEILRLKADNRLLRYLLAMAHNSATHMIYGDDGELYCNACLIDFVGDSAQEIERKLQASVRREIARLVESGTWPWKHAGPDLSPDGVDRRAGLSGGEQ